MGHKNDKGNSNYEDEAQARLGGRGRAGRRRRGLPDVSPRVEVRKRRETASRRGW